MIFKNTMPILYSSHVLQSLSYYTDVLGFERRWHWGDPPSFGGVGKDTVEIFFCEKGQGNPGTWLSVFVNHVDELYERVKAKGGTIVSPPRNMEWGIREMLVEDPDGHKIRFGEYMPVSPNREKSAPILPSTVEVIARAPTVKEYRHLISAVGWSTSPDDAIVKTNLDAAIFAVVAEDTITGKVIGCALLVAHHASFYYIKDVMVQPNWQGKRVGTAMMAELSRWLDHNAPNHTTVTLFTGERLAPFYKQFGFAPVYAMNRWIRRDEQ